MSDPVHKLFGLNRTNLFGWIAAGLVVFGAAARLAFAAWERWPARHEVTAELVVLTLIALFLFAIFGLLLQLYLGLIVEKFERDAAPRTSMASGERAPVSEGIRQGDKWQV
jgi:hypothetical protein